MITIMMPILGSSGGRPSNGLYYYSTTEHTVFGKSFHFSGLDIATRQHPWLESPTGLLGGTAVFPEPALALSFNRPHLAVAAHPQDGNC
jgi:hypothetical protein